MSRVVVLLRGVNVGAGRKLPMAALRSALAAAGCTDVTTYIQSGNVVLTPPPGTPAGDLASRLEQVVAEVAGFPVPVVLRTAQELAGTCARCPFPDTSTVHVMFFAERPDSVLRDVDVAAFAPEGCTLVGRDLYLQLPNGMGRAKLPAAVEAAARRQRPPAVSTTRNWNTVDKLVELARS